jgi:hypothetical protein
VSCISDNFFAGIKKCVGIIVAAYADTQEVRDPGLVKMPHQYALFTQGGVKFRTAFSGFLRRGGKDEIRLGRQHSETKGFKFRCKAASRGNDPAVNVFVV